MCILRVLVQFTFPNRKHPVRSFGQTQAEPNRRLKPEA